jgi:predicted tellurium resistance membrane protein TerC
MALLWIAVKLLADDNSESSCDQAGTLTEAIKIILFADLIMSLDNVLALAAVAQTIPDSKYSLIIIGLATSIPLVVFGAQILMKLMDKFPMIIYIGAGVLGYAAAEMIVSDKAIGALIGDYKLFVEIAAVIAVVAIGHWRKMARKAECESIAEKNYELEG